MLAPTQSAFAGTASVIGSDVVYTAAAGEVNNVSVVRTVALVYEITDTGAPVIAGTGCVQVNPQTASCTPPPRPNDRIVVRLGDLDDGGSVADLCPDCDFGGPFELVALIGGEGNDTLTSGETGARLLGGAGDDTLLGAEFSDLLVGGPGADLMQGGSAIDPEGEAGGDQVSYAGYPVAVHVDFDGVADDGAAGEGDNAMTDVEGAIGGAGNDVLIGNSNDNPFVGNRGSDRIWGGPGFDSIEGGRGDDIIRAGAGPDILKGHQGDDWISAGAGRDDVAGGDLGSEAPFEGVIPDYTGRDTIFGGPDQDGIQGHGGDDRIYGGDGPDFIWGQRGRDLLVGGRGADFFIACPDGSVDAIFGGAHRDSAQVSRFDVFLGVEVVQRCSSG